MILARRLMQAVGTVEQGYQIITNVTGTWTVPSGVVEIAAMAIARGGPSESDNFPPLYAAGGGAVAYSNSVSVTPGETLRIGTNSVASTDGKIVERIELRRNNNTTIIVAAVAGSGPGGAAHGAGGSAASSVGDTRVAGASGTDNNRGGSSGKPGGATANTTDYTSGYGITLDDGFWSYSHQSGYGRGGTSGYPDPNDGGLRAIVISWGPGHGFSSSDSSYWAL